jgi:ribonuclease Z
MLFSEAAQLAKNGQVEELWLTHFSPSLNEPELFLEIAQEVFPNTALGEERKSTTILFPKEG